MADVRIMMRDRRCRRLAALLVDYAAGDLPAPQRRRVEEHVAGCAACASAVVALCEMPAALSAAAPIRDDAFWSAQRDAVMKAIGREQPRPIRARMTGFDWRLALPIAAAVAIAFAGYLSLRPPTVPGSIALDALPAEDVSALIEVAEGILPPQDLLPAVGSRGDEIGGAVDAGWIPTDELPAPGGWGGLDDGDLEALHGMLG